ncbi:MAG: T9SS C-terminal target domain-containing protein [Cryomorphaceae bacterium]|nr:MAG: T9SS C-terminal target domain-containing protein [Cryomorphaceae bacterium]
MCSSRNFLSKTVILLGFVFNCCFTQAQPNSYFANNPVWQESTSCAIPYPCVETDLYNYFIEGEAIFDGLTYVSLYKQGVVSRMYYENDPPEYCSGSEYYSDLLGYLRSENRQIFFRPANGVGEELLHDFNLSVGDTLPITNTTNPWGNTVVMGMDSIEVEGGYYMRFQLGGMDIDSEMELIEGVGSSKGLFAPIPHTLECGYNLHCYSQNQTTYFGSNDGNSCMLTVGIENEHDVPHVTIYPNPAVDLVQFNLSEVAGQVDIAVHSLTGALVKHAVVQNEAYYTMRCEDLPGGLYIATVRQNNQILNNTKLVIVR